MEFVLADDSSGLPKEDFAVVTANEAEALAKLAGSAWVKFSPQEADHFLEKPFGGAAGQRVLLRGLSLNESNGAFSVTWRAGAIQVHHGCLGRHPVPMTRRALVARLPEAPSEVYVDCSMAE
jgi:hypothetical protein